ncbi:hypothetical protein PRIPAC_75956 [Pristionchus pacificus]|uniref:Uncharacterized protein n=1 Tax=Pristionchus pacificus TaxID=54126 RepID=A0A2A6C913_PRIPA|nr:hypothetical protein PRIPAC_75956 [Pristionchus pacificus]|eukprot:PDM74568.1 hypothetical protein PRIPAC_41924 [Pristionchus pacificus]
MRTGSSGGPGISAHRLEQPEHVAKLAVRVAADAHGTMISPSETVLFSSLPGSPIDRMRQRMSFGSTDLGRSTGIMNHYLAVVNVGIVKELAGQKLGACIAAGCAVIANATAYVGREVFRAIDTKPVIELIEYFEENRTNHQK